MVGAVPLYFPPVSKLLLGPEGPGGSITLNQATFHPGNILTLDATTYGGTTPLPVDVYLSVRLPDETVLFVQRDGSFTSEARPIVSNWTVEPLSREIFRYTFGGAEPAGSYKWEAYFTEPGTTSIIGLTAQAAFTFNP
jgi:hypothetical protein